MKKSTPIQKHPVVLCILVLLSGVLYIASQACAGVCNTPPIGSDELCCSQYSECPAPSICDTHAVGYCAAMSWSLPDVWIYSTCANDAECSDFGGWCIVMGECYDTNGPTGRACVVGADPSLGFCSAGGGGTRGYAWCDNAHPASYCLGDPCHTGLYMLGAPCGTGEECQPCPEPTPTWGTASIAQFQEHGKDRVGQSSVVNRVAIVLLPIGVISLGIVLRRRKK